jgi:hypothetical protein
LHLSIFYEYQLFFQHRICFSIQPPDYSDPWPTLARPPVFFLIMLFSYLSGRGRWVSTPLTINLIRQWYWHKVSIEWLPSLNEIPWIRFYNW